MLKTESKNFIYSYMYMIERNEVVINGDRLHDIVYCCS